MRWFFLLMSVSLHAQFAPWGKDSALACRPSEAEPFRCTHSGAVAMPLIRFHKRVISPSDGPRSNFMPNSSQYTLDAMEKHGFLLGLVYGCDRLQRENKQRWVYKTLEKADGTVMKWDPLP